jgi:hypothetical protein
MGQFRQCQTQRLCQSQGCLQGRALTTPFKHADKRPVQTGRLSQVFLTHALFVSQTPDDLAHPGRRVYRQTLHALRGHALGRRQL